MLLHHLTLCFFDTLFAVLRHLSILGGALLPETTAPGYHMVRTDCAALDAARQHVFHSIDHERTVVALLL